MIVPSWLGTLLFGYRHILSNGSAISDADTIDFLGYTVIYDSVNKKVTIAPDASAPIVGTDLTVSTITLAGQPDPFISGPYTHTTTNATPYTIKTIAVAVASTLDVEIRCIAILGTGPNANSKPTVYRFPAVGARVGTAGVDALPGSGTSDVSAPFVQAQNSGSPGPGSVNVVASGNNLLIPVVGFAIKEAWTSGHAYVTGDGASVPGDFVTSSGGVWLCTSPGTASGGAPSGTGTGVGTGAKFDYMGPASGSSVTVSWTLIVTGLVGGG